MSPFTLYRQRRSAPAVALLAVAIMAGCSGVGPSSPATATTVPTGTVVPTGTPAPSRDSALHIGLVTDVGTIDDHGIDQASWAGTVDAASRLGAGAPTALHSVTTRDIQTQIQSLLADGANVIVTVGYAADDWTFGNAKDHPAAHFIGVDQRVCVTSAGEQDTTGECAGNAATLLPNLQGLKWKHQDAGYLAGVVAASISRSGHIAAIGQQDSPWITNYMIGFKNGAQSVNSAIKVETPFATIGDDWVNQYNHAAGKDVTQKLLAASPDIDVVFQAAGGEYDAGGYQVNTSGTTAAGILEAACARSGVHAIGVGVDQHLSLATNPGATKCLVTSAMNSFATSVSNAIVRVSEGKAIGGTIQQNVSNNGIDLAPFYDFQNLITPAIQGAIDRAKAGLKDGTIKACVEGYAADCVSPAPAQ